MASASSMGRNVEECEFPAQVDGRPLGTLSNDVEYSWGNIVVLGEKSRSNHVIRLSVMDNTLLLPMACGDDCCC